MKTMMNDLELLHEYTLQNSEEAFAALVHRHLDLVYSAALRQARSPQLAEEVAQSVFTDLSRNAWKLKSGTILTAWDSVEEGRLSRHEAPRLVMNALLYGVAEPERAP